MPDTIECDFVFVPDGAPWPWDWIQRHPLNMVLPARFEGSPEFMRRMFGPRTVAQRLADPPLVSVREVCRVGPAVLFASGSVGSLP